LSPCVYLLSRRRLVATLPIHALFTAYVAEDTPLCSKQHSDSGHYSSLEGQSVKE